MGMPVYAYLPVRSVAIRIWSMKTNKEIMEVCRAFSKGYDEVEKFIMEWGQNNTELNRPIQRLMALNNDARYPQGYGGMSAGNYLISLVLTNQVEVAKLFKKHAASLTSKGKQALNHWGEHSPFWCYFAVKERLEDNFLTILDLISGEEHLLYSAGITTMQRTQESREKHYLTLMLPNGECLQTAGILRYNSLPVSDFLFYCDLFAPDEDLDFVINNHYVEFFNLDEISSMPVVIHRDNPVLHTWQPFTLETFAIEALGGEWTVEEKGNLISYSLAEPDDSMMDLPNGELLKTDWPSMNFTLYRDTSTGAMAISTTALASYAIIASLLRRSYPELHLPEVPEVAISMILLLLLSRMNLDTPWYKFKAFMDFEKEESEPESPDMTAINKLLQVFMNAQNSGKPFDAKAYSKKSGLALDMVESVIESLQKTLAKNMPTYKVSAEDAVYELTGWPVPPPATRRVFSDSLIGSQLFTFDEGPKTLSAFDALSGGGYKDEIFKAGLLAFIENMFLETFVDYRLACTLENSFFWILFHKGKEWLPVRSYAIEMLKLFPHPLGKAYPDPEGFIEEFSIFTRQQLSSRGICSLKSRPSASAVSKGTYLIKGSDAFYSLVEGINA